MDPTSKAVIAVKGSEPACSDFPALLQHLQRPSYSAHNQAEHLVFEEQKIPGCLSLAEAVGSARVALEVQVAHQRHYGELARLPIPAFVLAHDAATCERVLGNLRDHLGTEAFERVASWVRRGLGVYGYVYARPPIRARDIGYWSRGETGAGRAQALSASLEVDVIVARWFETVARLLWLGYLPTSLASLRTGSMCQPQNACMDGGFVDLDSVVRIDALPTTSALESALELSIRGLVETVETLALGSDRRQGSVRCQDHHLLSFVLEGLRRGLMDNERSGLVLDARVHNYFEPAGTFRALRERLAVHEPPKDPAYDDAAKGFAVLGGRLLAACR